MDAIELQDFGATAVDHPPSPPDTVIELRRDDAHPSGIDIELMELVQSRQQDAEPASFTTVSGDLLLMISLRNLDSLAPLTAVSRAVRESLLEQLGSLRGGLKLSRREVSVGLAEMIARMPLEWIELDQIGGPPRRVQCSDLRSGMIPPCPVDVDSPHTPDADPLLALLAAPIIRNAQAERVLMHCGGGRMLDLARSITDNQLWWLQSMPPPTREVAYILIAGLLPPDAGFTMRVSLDGLTSICGSALAAAEWRRGEQFVYVDSAKVAIKGMYSRHLSQQQQLAIHPTRETALGALDRCRRTHSVQLSPHLRAELPAVRGASSVRSALEAPQRVRAWLRSAEAMRALKACTAFSTVLAVICVSAVHLTTHATSRDSGVV